MTLPPPDEASAVRGPLSDEEIAWTTAMLKVDLGATISLAEMVLDLDTALRAALQERDEARADLAGFIRHHEITDAIISDAQGLSPKDGKALLANMSELRTRLAEVEKERDESNEDLGRVRTLVNATSEDVCVDIRRIIDRKYTLEAQAGEMRKALKKIKKPLTLGEVSQIDQLLLSTTAGTRALACVEALRDHHCHVTKCVACDALAVFDRDTGKT